jgi:hypothetical protein
VWVTFAYQTEAQPIGQGRIVIREPAAVERYERIELFA